MKRKSNIEIVKDYYEGNRPFIQIGYDSNLENTARKEGEIWEDSKGKKWIWKNGLKRRLPKKATIIVEQRCKECNADVRWGNYLDLRVWSKTKMCYDCFNKSETKMKIDGVWEIFNQLRDLRNEKDFLLDYKKKFEETKKWCEDNQGKPIEFFNEDGSVEKWEGKEDLTKILNDVNTDLEKVNTRLSEIDGVISDLEKKYESAKPSGNNKTGV